MTTLLWLFIWFNIKHFICDFPLQTQLMLTKKNAYGHIGGLLHAACHAAGTVLVMICFTPYALLFGLLDGVIHYHIDWAKMNLNSSLKLTPASSYFWWLLGLDQLAHYLTYCFLIYIFTLI